MQYPLSVVQFILSKKQDSVTKTKSRDVIVPAFPGTLLLSQWIITKAIPGKTGTNHIRAWALAGLVSTGGS